jgi:hypothetical protein
MRYVICVDIIKGFKYSCEQFSLVAIRTQAIGSPKEKAQGIS